MWFRKILLRRKWQPTPVFPTGIISQREYPGGPQSVGCKESDTTEQLSMHACIHVCMHACMQVQLGHHGDGEAAGAGVTIVG